MVVVLVFVLRVAPVLDKFLQLCWNTGIRFVEVKQGLGIMLMLINDLLPSLIVRFRIFVVHTDHVGGKTSPVVDVRFIVWHPAPDKIVVDPSFIGLGVK